jgi:hypothetical protein
MILKVYLEYSIPVFIAALGVIQAAAAYNNLTGLRFFRQKIVTYAFSTLLLLPALYYLFTWNQRNVTGIIEGAQQVGLFFGSVLLALVSTLVVSSLVNTDLTGSKKPANGLEVFKETTFIKTLQGWFNKSS